MLQRTCPFCHAQSKGIDAWGPTPSIAHTFLVFLIDHHALREESLAIRHAFENDLSPDTDSKFLRFLFQDLCKRHDQWNCCHERRARTGSTPSTSFCGLLWSLRCSRTNMMRSSSSNSPRYLTMRRLTSGSNFRSTMLWRHDEQTHKKENANLHR